MPVQDTIERTTIKFIAVPAPDPFDVADPCPMNAGGPHHFKQECDEVVCVHCSKVVWQ